MDLHQHDALRDARLEARNAWDAASSAASAVAVASHYDSNRSYWHDEAVRYNIRAVSAQEAANEAMLHICGYQVFDGNQIEPPEYCDKEATHVVIERLGRYYDMRATDHCPIRCQEHAEREASDSNRIV